MNGRLNLSSRNLPGLTPTHSAPRLNKWPWDLRGARWVRQDDGVEESKSDIGQWSRDIEEKDT